MYSKTTPLVCLRRLRLRNLQKGPYYSAVEACLAKCIKPQDVLVLVKPIVESFLEKSSERRLEWIVLENRTQ